MASPRPVKFLPFPLAWNSISIDRLTSLLAHLAVFILKRRPLELPLSPIPAMRVLSQDLSLQWLKWTLLWLFPAYSLL